MTATLPIDIHTHHTPTPPATAIVCHTPADVPPYCPARQATPPTWLSVGIHPWDVGPAQKAGQLPRLLALLARALARPDVVAIGEAGLDKLATAPMELQTDVFLQQARMAEETGKPLVIHLVKAQAELLAAHRMLRPTVPWILHGFRGKAQLATDYLRHGFWLSFGEHWQAEALRTVPSDRLLLETDDCPTPLPVLLQRVAQARETTPERLLPTLRDNVRRVFFPSFCCYY